MKQCKQCQTQFEVTPADRAFYTKMDVPEPTLCPACRQQRRLSWRNERTLYQRKCDSCGQNMISIYSSQKPFKVFCSQCWWNDAWNGTDFGRDFDFRRPFFEQFRELQLAVPRITLYGKENENSEYTNHTDHAKDSYMCVDVGYGEKIYYSQWMIYCRDCADSYQLMNSELCYDCIYADKLYNSVGCFFADNSNDCKFIYHSEGAGNCFLTANKPKSQNVYRGEQLTKEEFQKRMKEIDLGSYQTYCAVYNDFLELLKKAKHKHAEFIQTEDCSGDYQNRTKNVKDSYDVVDAEHCRFCYECVQIKDSYDAYESGFKCEMQYETHGCNRTNNTRFTSVCYDDSFVEYCDLSHNSFNLFGCVGMKKNEYCILNKQYTKEEYAVLKARIISHMKETGEYGEFFPAALSPFGYNETVAPYHFPLDESKAKAAGFNWFEGEKGISGRTTLPPNAIPDHIKDVPDSIIKEILECVSCKKNYKIIKQEFDFYKKQNLPIPRLCPNCRYMRRIALRNPRRLWDRVCSGSIARPDCKNSFQTTYVPEFKGIVLCSECYKSEVY